jgi:hypothetical protein
MTFSCKWFEVTDEEFDTYCETFPGVPVAVELQKMKVWLQSNPHRANKKNWPRFICNWLGACHGRLLQAQTAAEVREYLRTAQRRADANVGLWEGYRR